MRRSARGPGRGVAGPIGQRGPAELLRVERPGPFILQWARSGQIVPNPISSEIIRAGGFANRVLFYRHDLIFGKEGVPAHSHAFYGTLDPARPNFRRVALGAQRQIGTFFETDGAKVTRPEPAELWEWPIHTPLPEDTFYLPRPR